jgi:serine/threonine-protein kinase
MHQATEERWEEARRVFAQRWRKQVLRRLLEYGAREDALPRVGEVVGGVTLEARLGAGGYGTVFRARRGDSLFAVKFLYLPQVGRRAVRELEVLLRLHHLRLVMVDGHGHHGHCPGFGPLFLYIVMGYVPGLPMDVWVERHNPVAPWCARAVLALAEQLGRAHAAGVVHRDVKPDNVVVGEGDGRPVLVDYGVGTFPGALRVTGGQVPGAAPFRCPEAWRFRREREEGELYEASARDDLWALGVLFYWLLTGTLPFEGESEQELEDAVLHGALVPPRERNPRVPQALSAVCARMLEKAPEARYPDVEAVCEALESALDGADASWEVPLCEAWGPDIATTRSEEEPGDVAVAVDLEGDLARHRRVLVLERERPRRGRPATTEAAAPASPPEVDAPLADEAEGLAPSAPAPSTVGDSVAEAVSAPVSWRARAVSWGARVWRRRTLALGVGSLLAAAHPYGVPEPFAEVSPPGRAVAVLTSPVAGFVPMPEVTPVAGQEVAPPWCALEGGRGAAPAWAAIPAPVASATLPEDSTRVKTSRKDSSTQEKQKKGTVGNVVARALCTATAGALAAGCPGAQVRPTPAPEACPPGALEAMKQLGIHTGDEVGSNFPGAHPGSWLVHEGPGAQLVLGEDLGKLEAGTVLMGRLLFGKERVYGRFTEARTPGGEAYPVCVEAWDYGSDYGRGLVYEPNPNGGPGTAVVNAGPHVQAVERFE